MSRKATTWLGQWPTRIRRVAAGMGRAERPPFRLWSDRDRRNADASRDVPDSLPDYDVVFLFTNRKWRWE